TSYIHYATNANISNLSPAEQDNFTFGVAHSLFVKQQYGAAVEAINAYFDKFPKPMKEKHARYIRGVSLYRTGQPMEALRDLNIVAFDWSRENMENDVLTAAEIYLDLEEYNEEIEDDGELEVTTADRENYSDAVTHLLRCCIELGDVAEVTKYAKLIKDGS